MLPSTQKRQKHEGGDQTYKLLSGFRAGGAPLLILFFALFGLTAFFWITKQSVLTELRATQAHVQSIPALKQAVLDATQRISELQKEGREKLVLEREKGEATAQLGNIRTELETSLAREAALLKRVEALSAASSGNASTEQAIQALRIELNKEREHRIETEHECDDFKRKAAITTDVEAQLRRLQTTLDQAREELSELRKFKADHTQADEDAENAEEAEDEDEDQVSSGDLQDLADAASDLAVALKESEQVLDDNEKAELAVDAEQNLLASEHDPVDAEPEAIVSDNEEESEDSRRL